MSLSCKELSIVSLGFSCQVTHQLRLNCKMIADELCIPNLKTNALYFDYIISARSAVLLFMQDEFPRLNDANEINLHSYEPHWAKEKVWFTHNFRRGGLMTGEIDINGEFENSSEKISYLRTKFLDLKKQTNKIIFISSNAQKNLRHYTRSDQEFIENFTFDETYAASLRFALSAKFEDKLAGILLVENDTVPWWDWEIEGIERRIVPTVDVWSGDDAAWATMLREAIPAILGR